MIKVKKRLPKGALGNLKVLINWFGFQVNESAMGLSSGKYSVSY